jgi:hypothetical protein
MTRARLSRRRPTRDRKARDALARLRRDTAVKAADPAARAWLLALLGRGEGAAAKAK